MPSSFQLFEDPQDPHKTTGWSYPSVHKPSQVFIQDEEIQVTMIGIGRAVLKFKKSHQAANPGRLEQMHGAQVRFYVGTDFFHEKLDEKQLSVAFSELREFGEKTRPWEKPTHDERLLNMLSGKGAAPKRKGPKSILKVKEGPKDFTLEEKLAAAAINLAAAKWAYTTAVFIFCKKEQELQELSSQELSSKKVAKFARLDGIATKSEAESSDRVSASTSSRAWASSTLVDMHIAEKRAAAYAKLNGLRVQSEAETESYASSTLNMEEQVDEATAPEPFSKRDFHEMLAANSYHYNDTGTAILKFVTHLRRRTRNDLFTAKEKQNLMALTKVIRFNIKFPEATIAIRKWKRSIGTEDELEADSGLAVSAARTLIARGVGAVLATLGPKGALLVTADGAWHATRPPVEARSTVGAGDSSLAGFLLADVAGAPPRDCLRQAVAHGAAAASLPGTTVPTLAQTDPGAVTVTEIAGPVAVPDASSTRAASTKEED